jgi:hypothetical protein
MIAKPERKIYKSMNEIGFERFSIKLIETTFVMINTNLDEEKAILNEQTAGRDDKGPLTYQCITTLPPKYIDLKCAGGRGWQLSYNHMFYLPWCLSDLLPDFNIFLYILYLYLWVPLPDIVNECCFVPCS